MPLPLPKISHTLLGEREEVPKKWGPLCDMKVKTRGGRETRKGTPALPACRVYPHFLLNACCISSNPVVHICHFLTNQYLNPFPLWGDPQGLNQGINSTLPWRGRHLRGTFPVSPWSVQTQDISLSSLTSLPWTRFQRWQQVKSGAARTQSGKATSRATMAAVVWWLSPAPGSAALGGPLAGCGSGESCLACSSFPWLRSLQATFPNSPGGFLIYPIAFN